MPHMIFPADYCTSVSQDTADGLRSAKRIAENLNLEGYYGPLYELFDVDDRYKTAVEVTAGTRWV